MYSRYKNLLINKWHYYSGREKKVIAAIILALGLTFTYLGVYLPIHQMLNNKRQHLYNQYKLLTWMRAARQQMHPTDAAKIPQADVKLTTPIELMNFLKVELQKLQVENNITSLKQSGNETIELAMQKIRFNKLLNFLLLINQYHLNLTNLNINAHQQNGVVDITLALKYN